MQFDYNCPFCLSRKTLRFGHDKNGKPFWNCTMCGTRIFTKYFSRTKPGWVFILNLMELIDRKMGLEDLQRYLEPIASKILLINDQASVDLLVDKKVKEEIKQEEKQEEKQGGSNEL